MAYIASPALNWVSGTPPQAIMSLVAASSVIPVIIPTSWTTKVMPNMPLWVVYPPAGGPVGYPI